MIQTNNIEPINNLMIHHKLASKNKFVLRWSVSHAEAHASNLSSTSAVTITHICGHVAASKGKNKERKGHNMSAAMDMDYFGLYKVGNKGKEGESCSGDKQDWLQLRHYGYKYNF